MIETEGGRRSRPRVVIMRIMVMITMIALLVLIITLPEVAVGMTYSILKLTLSPDQDLGFSLKGSG